MPAFIDLSEKKFGRLKALSYAGRNKWLCECECGKQKLIGGGHLRGGHTISCGCAQREAARKINFKHGHSDKKHPMHPTFSSWRSMQVRCNDRNYAEFHIYGGRGIKICDRWKDYINFFFDMGPRPDGHTLDRIDPNGNYEPENCRWATPKMQSINRRVTTIIEFNGESLCIADWARKIGRSPLTVKRRLSCGWDIERALTA